ncbi:hypothetical protein GCM10029964_056640 [Kibdelosporangium lantanae]
MLTTHWSACGMREVPEADDWLSAAEAARLATTRFAKRRSELRLSRWTVKHAIALGTGTGDRPVDLARIEVRPAPTGAPVAFVDGRVAPVSVALTDRADWAVCLVGPPGVALGADLELVEPRSTAFVHDWFTPAERDLVLGGGDNRDLLANLVWSAKESVLKVLGTGLRRDTRSVAVDLPDRAGGDYWARFVVRAREGTVFPGWWRRYGRFLLTVAADRGLAVPACVREPPPLATAVPTHSWITGCCPGTAPSPVPPRPPGTAAGPGPG